ncbi:MAG: DUF5063 domain-containing protein [Leptospiraceae bacterium]|nr:DUF5063 domain-containing protein [Leptospiraceae bacterium]
MQPIRVDSSTLTITPIGEFLSVARSFCAFCERNPVPPIRNFIEECLSGIVDLYRNALMLPEIHITRRFEAENEDFLKDYAQVAKRISIFLGQYDVYWFVYNPYYQDGEEPVCSTISDDLGDIYSDIKRNLRIIDTAELSAIEHGLWELRFLFQNHWGHHAVCAMSAIHALCMGPDCLPPELV